MYDTIILGAGPAGLTAGIYLARAKKSVLIIDSGTIGGAPILTHMIANYPGVEEIHGYELAFNMKNQAKSFGCKVLGNKEIDSLNLSGDIKTVILKNGKSFESRTLIIATGGKPRNIGIESESKFKGKGISYCATCDGDFFTDKEIVVIGGGNSALEEAVSLSTYASKINLLHEFDHFQAFQLAVEAATTNEKINFIMDVKILDFKGNEKLDTVVYRENKSGEIKEIHTEGVFIFIGYVPSTDMFKDMIKLNRKNEIITDNLMETSIKGVYAAGDVREKRYRQITTAVSDGTVAALSILEKLESSESQN